MRKKNHPRNTRRPVVWQKFTAYANRIRGCVSWSVAYAGLTLRVRNHEFMTRVYDALAQACLRGAKHRFAQRRYV